jgi:hypothetical protein
LVESKKVEPKLKRPFTVEVLVVIVCLKVAFCIHEGYNRLALKASNLESPMVVTRERKSNRQISERRISNPEIICFKDDSWVKVDSV